MIPLALELAARTRTALVWWTLGILGMATYVVVAFDSLANLEDIATLYEDYPPAVRELFGEVDISKMDGWIQVELVSYLPLLLAVYAGIYAAGTVSREMEQRTIDFVLGLPISRTEFIASRVIVGLWNLFLICLAVFVFLVIGVALVGHTPSAGRYALALLNAYLLAGALLTAYVAIATVVDEQARLTGITLGLTFVLLYTHRSIQGDGRAGRDQVVDPVRALSFRGRHDRGRAAGAAGDSTGSGDCSRVWGRVVLVQST